MVDFLDLTPPDHRFGLLPFVHAAQYGLYSDRTENGPRHDIESSQSYPKEMMINHFFHGHREEESNPTDYWGRPVSHKPDRPACRQAAVHHNPSGEEDQMNSRPFGSDTRSYSSYGCTRSFTHMIQSAWSQHFFSSAESNPYHMLSGMNHLHNYKSLLLNEKETLQSPSNSTNFPPVPTSNSSQPMMTQLHFPHVSGSEPPSMDDSNNFSYVNMLNGASQLRGNYFMESREDGGKNF